MKITIEIRRPARRWWNQAEAALAHADDYGLLEEIAKTAGGSDIINQGCEFKVLELDKYIDHETNRTFTLKVRVLRFLIECDGGYSDPSRALDGVYDGKQAQRLAEEFEGRLRDEDGITIEDCP